METYLCHHFLHFLNVEFGHQYIIHLIGYNLWNILNDLLKIARATQGKEILVEVCNGGINLILA